MIEIESLTKKFGSKLAVDSLTLTIPGGQVFVFLGPNGAGKTTTLKLTTGLLRPTSGRVRVCGYDVAEQPEAAKAVMSYVPDQPYLYGKLTGREFLHFVAEMYGVEQSAATEKIRELRDLFELDDYIDELSEEYSHGMKQRVVLSAALLHDPKVIVIDEPMVGLDPKSIRLTKNLFRRLASEGAAVFMSTHTLSVAEEVAHEIGIISKGKLIARGALDELRAMASGVRDLEALFLQLTAEGSDG